MHLKSFLWNDCNRDVKINSFEFIFSVLAILFDFKIVDLSSNI